MPPRGEGGGGKEAEEKEELELANHWIVTTCQPHRVILGRKRRKKKKLVT